MTWFLFVFRYVKTSPVTGLFREHPTTRPFLDRTVRSAGENRFDYVRHVTLRPNKYSKYDVTRMLKRLRLIR